MDPMNYTIPRDNCADPAAAHRHAAARVSGLRNLGSNQMSLCSNTYNGYANTNELQAQITHTWGNGLTLQSYFTWGKLLTNYRSWIARTDPSGIQHHTLVPAALTPGYNLAEPLTSGASTSDRLRAIYSNDPTLPTKTFQLNGHYQFPFGKGQRYPWECSWDR